MNLPRLSRATYACQPAAPARLLHVGPGAFHRSHQAWFTARASSSPSGGGDAAGRWGIAVTSLYSGASLRALGPQDGLYSLLTRGPGADALEVVDSIVAVLGPGDPAVAACFASEALAVVTLTVTEAGYSAPLEVGSGAPGGVAGFLLAGLEARRLAGGAPLAVCSCDNLPGNGDQLRFLLLERCQQLGRQDLAGWIAEAVSFPSSVVDRVTPRATAADHELAGARLGLADEAVTVTEPFAEWVLAGVFPAGRPPWERAGVQFTGDVTPFSERKLRLLNGAHSLLAYLGSLRGHDSVEQAIGDPFIASAVEAYWDEASSTLATEMRPALPGYRAALLARFANPAIDHRLAQIAEDGSVKLVARVVPVLRERHRARQPVDATALVVAAWLLHLRGRGRIAVRDVAAATVTSLGSTEPVAAAARALLRYLAPELDDGELAAAVAAAVGALLRP